jgi:hypothetical protein
MMQSDFIASVAAQLHLAGVPFDRTALVAFVADAWPWIEEDPCVNRWAREFMAATAPAAA